MAKTHMLSVYEGMFSGGARYLHTDIVLGFSERALRQEVLSINSVTLREEMIQHMEHDQSFLRLSAAGVKVSTLGRSAGYEPDRSRFTGRELARFTQLARRARLIFTVKEQPLRLTNQASAQLPPVVVGLHRSDPERQGEAIKDLLLGVERNLVRLIVTCSESARRAYAEIGVPERVITCVPNGINLQRFTLCDAPGRRAAMRQENAVDPRGPVIVLAARYDPMKDVGLFLQAARAYLRDQPSARIFICGAGMTLRNQQLSERISSIFAADIELAEQLTLLGVRHDMEMVYSMADVVACTSAYGEAYPLCLVEGLACGAVPVATDVGDTADIAGAGRGIITSRNPDEIAAAWHSAYLNRGMHVDNIMRTRQRFDRGLMLDAYQALLRPLLAE